MRTFTAYIEYDPETSLYVGTIPAVHGAHTQGATLDELNNNLREVLELCLAELDEPLETLPRFVRTTAVPNHSGRDLSRPLLREILREIELTPDEFTALLRRR